MRCVLPEPGLPTINATKDDNKGESGGNCTPSWP